MKRLRRSWERLRVDEGRLEKVEYGLLIAAMMAVTVAVAAVSVFFLLAYGYAPPGRMLPGLGG